jgi:hypothetical protein
MKADTSMFYARKCENQALNQPHALDPQKGNRPKN